MPVCIDLPPDQLIDCWALVRNIASTVVPDLNPAASGIECIIAKRPILVDVAGVGPVEFVERDLTGDDRRYLQRVLPDLPELRIPYSDDVAEAFLKSYRTLPDRPNWEPVLLTESRYLQEYDRLICLRWQASAEHLQVLQHWLDTDRIKAFRREHVPATELLIGTLIPRQDVHRYLDYCGIDHPVAESSAHSPSRTECHDTQNIREELTVSTEALTMERRQSPQSPQSPQSTQPASNPVRQDEPSKAPVEQAAVIPSGPLLDIKEVSERTGISVSMLHEKMKPASKYYDANFAPKIPLGERTVRYSQTAVDAWIQQRLSATKK